MAVVPNDEIATAQQEPLPGRAFPRFSDEANPSEFGYGVGAGLEKAAGDIQKVTNQANELAVTKQHTALLNAANQLQFDPQNGAYTKEGENAINLVGQYGPKLDQTIQQLTQGLSNPAQRQAFSQLAARESVSFNLNLNRHEQEQQRVAATEIYKNSIEADAKNAESHYNDPVLVQQMKDHIKDTAEKLADHLGVNQKDGLPTGYGANIASAYFERIDGNVARGIVDREPLESYKDLLSDKPKNEAFANLKSAALKDEMTNRAKVAAAHNLRDGILGIYRTNGAEAGARAYASIDEMQGVPEDFKELGRADVEAGLGHLRNEMSQKYGQQMSAVNEHLASSKATADDISAVNDLFHNNAISPAEQGSMVGRIQAQIEANVPDEAGKVWALDRIRNGLPMNAHDATTVKAVNAAWGDLSAGKPELSDAWVNTASNILAQTGVLPKGAVDTARAFYMGSTDLKAAGAAATAMRRWQNESKSGYDYAMDAKAEAIFGVTSDMLNGGAKPEDAVAYGRELQHVSKEQTVGLEIGWKKLGKTNSASAKLSVLDEALNKNTGYFQSKMDIPPEVQGAYVQMTHDFYKMNGGNIEAARATAIKNIQQKWGETSVNGKREIMEYAPEHMSPWLSTDAIQTKMRTNAQELTPGVDPSKVRLVPSHMTEYSNGQSWHLGVPDEHGLNSIMTAKDGRPYEFKLPSPADAQHSDLKKVNDEAMTKARAKQREWQNAHEQFDPDKVEVVGP